MIWGANPENSEINRGKPAEIVDAMQAGMKVIDIRPMREGLGSKADIWVPVRPGTDLALALAVLNVICKEGLYDYDFTTNWCNGFDKLAEHVAQFTPEWASPITGVPEEQIYEIARMMGTAKPMGILYGNGIGDQANDGNWACICICLIEAITGNLDIPGGGGAGMTLPPSLIKTNAIEMLTERLEATPEDEEKGYFPGMSKLVANEFPRWYQNKDTFGGGPGPTSAYFKAFMSILTEEPYPLRCVIGQNSNPLSATRQPKKIIEALKKLEYYVVVDTAWNPSCDYADIVLPALTNYETSQQFNVNNRVDGTWIGMNQVIVDPIGEGKSDWDFYMDLAVAMGYGDDFWGGDMDECLRWQLEPSGISLEELREKGQVFVERTDGAEATEPQYRNYEKLFAKLPGGKVQCYNEYMGGKLNNLETDTLPYLPEYQGPPEGLAETPELAEEYPPVWIQVIPGITAACSGAALLGAPLANDFVTISLSDLLTPWETIERRLRAAAAGDFCLAIYNPASHGRPDTLQRACDILLETYSPKTPAGVVQNVGRDGEGYLVMTLEELREFPADMLTTAFVGNSTTQIIAGRMVTPRGYQRA